MGERSAMRRAWSLIEHGNEAYAGKYANVAGELISIMVEALGSARDTELCNETLRDLDAAVRKGDVKAYERHLRELELLLLRFKVQREVQSFEATSRLQKEEQRKNNAKKELESATDDWFTVCNSKEFQTLCLITGPCEREHVIEMLQQYGRDLYDQQPVVEEDVLQKRSSTAPFFGWSRKTAGDAPADDDDDEPDPGDEKKGDRPRRHRAAWRKGVQNAFANFAMALPRVSYKTIKWIYERTMGSTAGKVIALSSAGVVAGLALTVRTMGTGVAKIGAMVLGAERMYAVGEQISGASAFILLCVSFDWVRDNARMTSVADWQRFDSWEGVLAISEREAARQREVVNPQAFGTRLQFPGLHLTGSDVREYAQEMIGLGELERRSTFELHNQMMSLRNALPFMLATNSLMQCADCAWAIYLARYAPKKGPWKKFGFFLARLIVTRAVPLLITTYFFDASPLLTAIQLVGASTVVWDVGFLTSNSRLAGKFPEALAAAHALGPSILRNPAVWMVPPIWMLLQFSLPLAIERMLKSRRVRAFFAEIDPELGSSTTTRGKRLRVRMAVRFTVAAAIFFTGRWPRYMAEFITEERGVAEAPFSPYMFALRMANTALDLVAGRGAADPKLGTSYHVDTLVQSPFLHDTLMRQQIQVSHAGAMEGAYGLASLQVAIWMMAGSAVVKWVLDATGIEEPMSDLDWDSMDAGALLLAQSAVEETKDMKIDARAAERKLAESQDDATRVAIILAQEFAAQEEAEAQRRRQRQPQPSRRAAAAAPAAERKRPLPQDIPSLFEEMRRNSAVASPALEEDPRSQSALPARRAPRTAGSSSSASRTAGSSSSSSQAPLRRRRPSGN